MIDLLLEGKNTHMEHAEDVILNEGVDGTRRVINYFRALRDMLAGHTKAPVNVTVKWDGAPAIFAGVDPRDGQFFVAKKGVFNVNPKVYKTNADIDADISSPDLNNKMKLALAHLPKLGIKGVIQGDFLYSKADIRKVDIDGEPHITFHPNTIVYAIPANSDLAKKILGSELGIVWHTSYRGSSFESMSASFGETIASGLKKPKEVWSIDAVFKDVSGTATLTSDETKEVTAMLSGIGRMFNGIPAKVFNGISENEERLMRVKTYINSHVRAGQEIKNTQIFVRDMVKWILDYYKKEEDSRKTEAGKMKVRQKRDEVLSYFSNNDQRQIVALFDLYNALIEVKLILIAKLDKAKRIRTLLLTKDGYRVTGQEGFVAIDHIGQNAIKLVDRLQFSYANFGSGGIVRGWERK